MVFFSFFFYAFQQKTYSTLLLIFLILDYFRIQSEIIPQSYKKIIILFVVGYIMLGWINSSKKQNA